ncbi:MAG: hypothetical protein IT200_15925 [Thermoleophilia bacterium]|nr:hypothetical protein [Thermoleophilia bacterium]
MQITANSGAANTQRAFGPEGAGRMPPPPGGGPAKLAETLGVSTDELKAARDSGTTLTELAASKGISKDDLVAKLVQQMNDDRPEDAPEISDEDLKAMVTEMVDRVPGQGGPGGPRGAGGGSGDGGGTDAWHHHRHRGGDSDTSEQVDEVA